MYPIEKTKGRRNNMRRINETDIRKAGLIPSGHPTCKTAIQLFKRLSERYNTIEISYQHCINAQKRQWVWKNYRYIGIEDKNCLLREKYEKPLTAEKKEEFKQKLLNNEVIDFADYRGEEYLSDNITKIDAVDLIKCHDAYCANIYVD